MKKFLFVACLLLCCSACDFSGYTLENDYDFTTAFERSGGKETATYGEIIQYYEELAVRYPKIKLQTVGTTDSGKPLHLAIYSESETFNIEELHKDHVVLLINNAIHPGESDGIDATMMLFRDLALDSIEIPGNVVIATIPVYNTGGALNRNAYTRTNQNGPKAYGFRGNARNYDLNRDFIKADTRNTRSFYKIFHMLNPDFFIDNHVSNGADYQYTLTHLFTQHNRMGGELGKYISKELRPGLEKALADKGLDITPYVNVFNEVPEKGFSQFLDTPRYSTGYTALWNTVGMMLETHMLKPYKERVWGTYEVLQSLISLAGRDAKKVKELRKSAFAEFPKKEIFGFRFRPDSSKVSTLQFKGYEAERIKSLVTGFTRLKYDTTRPFTKEVNYWNSFRPTRQVSIPKGYIIPQGWWQVLDLLKLNQVHMQEFQKDTVLTAEVYHIDDFETRTNAYEGHYPHSDTQITASVQKVRIRKGDVYIPMDQPAAKYLMATLQPGTTDSFFNWNFFDTVLQQKEHFSPYVFEDVAREFLDNNPELEAEFLAKKKNDPGFAANGYAQLDWIHKHSPHYERSHLRYPIFRINR